MVKHSPADRLDAVITSVPQNATAARVLARGGDHYEPPAAHLHVAHSDTCPPMKSLDGLRATAGQFVRELLGRRFGRLTVLGVLDDPNRKSPRAAWVVRCLCGRYEIRTRRGLVANKGTADGEDRCSACLEKIKRAYREEGGRPLEDFTGRGYRA